MCPYTNKHSLPLPDSHSSKSFSILHPNTLAISLPNMIFGILLPRSIWATIDLPIPTALASSSCVNPKVSLFALIFSPMLILCPFLSVCYRGNI